MGNWTKKASRWFWQKAIDMLGEDPKVSEAGDTVSEGGICPRYHETVWTREGKETEFTGFVGSSFVNGETLQIAGFEKQDGGVMEMKVPLDRWEQEVDRLQSLGINVTMIRKALNLMKAEGYDKGFQHYIRQYEGG